MHNVAILCIAAQQIGDNLAESVGVETLVDILDGIVHILLRSGNTALVILVHSLQIWLQRYKLFT